MKILDDFVCLEGHEEERFVEIGTALVECNYCGLIASKVRSVPRFHLEGTSGDFPSAADRWVKDRADRLKQEEKAIDRHGDN